jgi:hypothetical protein
MLSEQKELYFYTKDKFNEELNRISLNCISPIIATRQIVKKAIDLYIKDYCNAKTQAENIFSEEDFQAVSKKIRDEIMKGEL